LFLARYIKIQQGIIQNKYKSASIIVLTASITTQLRTNTNQQALLFSQQALQHDLEQIQISKHYCSHTLQKLSYKSNTTRITFSNTSAYGSDDQPTFGQPSLA